MRYYDYTVKPYLNKLFDKLNFKKEIKISDLDLEEHNELLFYCIKLYELGFTELDCSNVETNLGIYLLTGEKKDKDIMADALVESYKDCFNKRIQEMIDKEFELYKDKQEVERKLEAGLSPTQDTQTGELIWR